MYTGDRTNQGAPDGWTVEGTLQTNQGLKAAGLNLFLNGTYWRQVTVLECSGGRNDCGTPQACAAPSCASSNGCCYPSSGKNTTVFVLASELVLPTPSPSASPTAKPTTGPKKDEDEGGMSQGVKIIILLVSYPLTVGGLILLIKFARSHGYCKGETTVAEKAEGVVSGAYNKLRGSPDKKGVKMAF